jgi:glucokinase
MILSIDIGGTKIAAGLVDRATTLHKLTTRVTPSADPQAIDATLAELWSELAKGTEIHAAGLAVAGLVEADQATVAFAPNIAWRHHPLAQNFRHLTGADLPVIVENDANAAAWGEYHDGAGQGSSTMVMLTVGTGLGGALITNGQLVRGGHGLAGEAAHMQLIPNGLSCGCGARGCWEQYASGTTLVRNARVAVTANARRARTLLELAAGEPDRLTGAHVTLAAQGGDPLATELRADLGRSLGVGAASITALLDPDVIVVGGGVSSAGELLLQPARESLLEHLPARFHRDPPTLRQAQHGNTAGLRGVARLARRTLLSGKDSSPSTAIQSTLPHLPVPKA